MKLLPKYPYLQNLETEYTALPGYMGFAGYHYRDWLMQFGFKVPVMGDYLEFPDDFCEKKLLLFKIRFGG